MYEVCKLSNETGNVAFDLVTLEARGLVGPAEEHHFHVQYEFDLARVIWLSVAIIFLKQFFLLCSKNE
jgi:hypothetical protein